ncbi:MAG: hypothetical protein JXQ71_10730 [Verrucomicrobia bacterium]|nr:hypothetical protein [Verrucomicrobiota bacterium]
MNTKILRVLVLHRLGELGAELKDLLVDSLETNGLSTPAQVAVEYRDGSELDHTGLIETVAAAWDVIVLPLDLPMFLSLRLAELIHLTNSGTRTIVTTDRATRERLLPLFNEALPDLLDLGELARLIRTVQQRPFCRLHNTEQTEAAVRDLFQQGCYTVYGCPHDIMGLFIKTNDRYWEEERSQIALQHYIHAFNPIYPHHTPDCPGLTLRQLALQTPVNYARRLKDVVGQLPSPKAGYGTFINRLRDHIRRLEPEMYPAVMGLPTAAERFLGALEFIPCFLSRRKDGLLGLIAQDISGAATGLVPFAPELFPRGCELLKLVFRLRQLRLPSSGLVA